MEQGYIPLFYFSGTGNTWWAAKQLTAALREHGFDPQPISIEQVDIPEVHEKINKAAIVGIGYLSMVPMRL